MNIPVTPLTLPAGFCPVTYQDIWNAFAAASQVTIPDALSQIVWQSTQPSDQTVSWGKVDSLGRPIGIYRFAQGAWLSSHPIVPGLTQWWFTAQPDFTSFDGGDANPISATSGPMWQLARDGGGNVIAAKFPITAGTLASGTILAVGNTGGEEKHLLTIAEAGIDPNHQHAVARINANNQQIAIPTGGTATHIAGQAVGGSGDVPPAAQSDYSAFGAATLQTDTPGSPQTTVSHQNMPPYITGYLLQRTSRLYYVG